MDGGSGAQPFEFLHGAFDAAPVEFVVAGNVKDRLGEAGCPGNRLPRASEVPRQDYNVGVILGYRQRAETQMQVGQDIEPHE